MKRIIVSACVALCVVAGALLFAAPAFAGENEAYITSLSQQKIDRIEENVVLALTSGIPGMQADASQLIRDLKEMLPEQSFSTTIIPLMGILKNEEAEQSARILAALALDRLESVMGNYAITRTAVFTDNLRVKHVCTWLAYEKKTGRSADSKGMAIIEPLEEFGY